MQQPQRETLTDNLADIIQVLQLGYRSGTLTVERMVGQTREEGSIVFVNGRVVDARVNQYDGVRAFNYLKTWRSCRFSFIDAGDAEPEVLQSRSQSFPRIPTRPLPQHLQNAADSHNMAWSSPFPRRLQAGEAALANPPPLQLERAYRRLLLLVNGQRSLSELARLMARDPEEVQVMLDALERAGLIQQ
jgi:hypothetical protein